MTHLTCDELVDLIDGALPAERARHVEVCPACRLDAARLRAALAQALEAADVPEPTDADWARIAARIDAALAVDAAGAGWRGWLHRPVLAPLAAAVLLAAGVVVATGLGLLFPWPGTRTPAGSVVALDDDEGWPAVAAILADLDPTDADMLHQTGLDVRPGLSDRLLPELSAQEWAELERLIALETGGPQP